VSGRTGYVRSRADGSAPVARYNNDLRLFVAQPRDGQTRVSAKGARAQIDAWHRG